MLIEVLKSKIHRVSVTQADLNYVGSITIDGELLDAAEIIEYQKVQVVNCNNGERLETYAIRGKDGSGIICMNGPAARKAVVGDIIVIMTFALIEKNNEIKNFKPKIIFPDTKTNKIVK